MRVLLDVSSSTTRGFTGLQPLTKVTTFAYRRGNICSERAIPLMSRQTPIYTICGLLYTAFNLGVRHIGQAGQVAVLLGSSSKATLSSADMASRVTLDSGSIFSCFPKAIGDEVISSLSI